MKKYDIVIIGGGASGMFLASNLKGKNVAILEKNAMLGKKILASGGGRCNITNRFISEKNYLGDQEFIKNVLKNSSFKEVLIFFNEFEFSEEKSHQFFCKVGSKKILDFLNSKIKNCDIYKNCEVLNIEKNEEEFEIYTKYIKFYAKKLVICTGGLSYKILGASDFGFNIASKFGIDFTKPSPALVGFTVQKDEFWFKNLSGISFLSKVFVDNREFLGDILFTHKGISGPAILNSSLFWTKGRIKIDFLPKFDFDKIKDNKKQLSSILPLPKRFTKEFLNKFSLEDKPFFKYKVDELEKIFILKNYIFSPAGNFGFEKAEVTKGGIKTYELDENFQSKKIKNLFFIGEVVDITGMLGGFNLHYCFASAKKLANYIKFYV